MHTRRSRASLNLPPLNQWFCGLLGVNGHVFVGISKPNLPVMKNFGEKRLKPLHWRFEYIWGMSPYHTLSSNVAFNNQLPTSYKYRPCIKKGRSSYAMLYSDIDFIHAASYSSDFSPNSKFASELLRIEARRLGKPIATEGTAPTRQACSTEWYQIIVERQIHWSLPIHCF